MWVRHIPRRFCWGEMVLITNGSQFNVRVEGTRGGEDIVGVSAELTTISELPRILYLKR